MKPYGLLGPVEIITKTKLILVKIEKPDFVPGIGNKVLDSNGIEVGRIIDIIGSIDKPFAVVKPASYAVLSAIKPSTVLFYRIVKQKRTSRGERK